jgi:long-subunit acyl-CoA synthetase (AMP-forming)
MPITRAPRKKMYRTMQGRMVDIEKLRGANEQVPAVGNMRVNARGDVLGPGGAILKTKEKVMKEYYETPRGRAIDTPRAKQAPQPRVAPQPQPKIQQMNPQVEQPKVTKQVNTFKPKAAPKSGIDAALDGIE